MMFQCPLFLLLLPLIIIALLLKHKGLFCKNPIAIPLVLDDWNGGHFVYKDRVFVALQIVKNISMLFAVSLCIISLAAPYKTVKKKVFLHSSMNIMFVLDSSPSMATFDIQNEKKSISRFQAAVSIISSCISSEHNAQYALINMATKTNICSPLTQDKQAILDTLHAIKIGEAGEATAIGMGLSLAAYHLKAFKNPCYIILFTDGYNNSGIVNPITSAELCKAYNIDLIAFKLGKEGTAPLEYTNDSGQLIKGIIHSQYNQESVEEMCQVSGGKCYNITSMSDIENVLEKSLNLKSNDAHSITKTQAQPLQRKLLIFVAFFAILGAFIKYIVLQEAY